MNPNDPAFNAQVAEHIHRLLGCSWGRTVSTSTDADLCPRQAVQIVVLHDGPEIEHEVRLCEYHLAVVNFHSTRRPE